MCSKSKRRKSFIKFPKTTKCPISCHSHKKQSDYIKHNKEGRVRELRRENCACV